MPLMQLELPDLPPPQPTEAAVLVEARRIWRLSPTLLRAYPVLEPLLAHPLYGRWLLMAARGALKVRLRRATHTVPH